jgi:hypothetical protein
MAKRCCGSCVYAMRPVSRWLRVIMLHWPGLFICFNSAKQPGKMQEAYGHTVCRNYRGRRWPAGRREKVPEPTEDGVCYIPLSQGEVAIVDREDYEELSKYTWYVTRHGGNKYACRKGKSILMHRMIMKPPRGMVVDHIDGNGLNNRRCNLRICTQGQNVCNRRPNSGNGTGFRGVELRDSGKYLAVVRHEGKNHRAGLFSDPVEAARARDKLARKLQGEFAWINLPEAEDGGKDLVPCLRSRKHVLPTKSGMSTQA